MRKAMAPIVSQEEVVHLFRDLTMPFIKAPATPLEDILSAFFAFYCDTRVEGADLEEEGDMILLEWGANCPHLIHSFMDFRESGGEEVDFDEHEYEWIGLTRQIQVGGGEEEEEGEAMGLCLFLYFSPAKEEDEENGGSLMIPTPEALRPKLKEWKQSPYVARLLKARASKVSGFVSAIG
jgi:hypothetical protein